MREDWTWIRQTQMSKFYFQVEQSGHFWRVQSCPDSWTGWIKKCWWEPRVGFITGAGRSRPETGDPELGITLNGAEEDKLSNQAVGVKEHRQPPTLWASPSHRRQSSCSTLSVIFVPHLGHFGTLLWTPWRGTTSTTSRETRVYRQDLSPIRPTVKGLQNHSLKDRKEPEHGRHQQSTLESFLPLQWQKWNWGMGTFAISAWDTLEGNPTRAPALKWVEHPHSGVFELERQYVWLPCTGTVSTWVCMSRQKMNK